MKNDKKEGVICGETCKCENNKQCAFNHLMGYSMAKLTKKQECLSRCDTIKYFKLLRAYYHIKYFRSYKDFTIHLHITMPF